MRALAAGREVLDGFSYTGGFAISALAGGAKRVSAIESSADAIQIAKENLAANPLAAGAVEFVQADVFKHLRVLRDAGARYDLIVLDPPKLAPTAAHAKNAARAYKDVNLLAFKLLAPGRAARHLLLLRRRVGGTVPVDRRRRGARRRRGGENH